MNILLQYIIHFLIFNLLLSLCIALHYSEQHDIVSNIFNVQKSKKYKILIILNYI